MHDRERFTKSAKNSWFLPPKKAGFGSQKGAKNEKSRLFARYRMQLSFEQGIGLETVLNP